MIRTLALLCLLASPSLAAEPSQAEVLRLEQAMTSLAQRGVWSGVERRFQEIVALGAPLSRDTLLLAATAAREQGDVLHHLARLVDAQALDDTEDIQGQILDVMSTFGRAQLHGSTATKLTADQPPFRPDAVKAIALAQSALTATGRFDGFLPEGSYHLNKKPFTVLPGSDPVRVSLLGQRAANRDFALDSGSFPKKALVEGHRVQLNGIGTRYKYGIAIYVGALYLTVTTNESAGAVRQNLPKRFIMEMVYERVSGQTMADQFRRGMTEAYGSESLKAEIERFTGWMENMNRGDRLVISYVPGTGTRVEIKGQRKGTIEGREFMWLLFSIFAGEQPVSERLRDGLIGR